MHLAKRSALLIAFTSAAFFAGRATIGLAQEPMTGDPMEAAMKLAQPGKYHKMLDPLVGTFQAEVKIWMDPTSTEPNVSHGAMTNSWILDGRFVQHEYEGEFMGEAFRGKGLTGYSNNAEEFQGLWVDTWTTNLSISNGEISADGKTLTLNKTDVDPTSGQEMTVKEVIQIVDKNKHTMTSFVDTPAGEQKMMEIVYTRK
jgi:hypothetical protein